MRHCFSIIIVVFYNMEGTFMKSKTLFAALVLLLLSSHIAKAQTPQVIIDESTFVNGIENLTFRSAKFNAIIQDSGSWVLNGKGFAVSVNPDCVAPYALRVNGTPAGYRPLPFSFSATTAADALIPNTTYYVRAYVKKGSPNDTAWSNVVSFTTPPAIAPTMNVDEAENIGLMEATIKGRITYVNDPVRTWTKKGFIYSTTPNPTHGAGTTEVSIAGTSPNNTNTNTPLSMSSNINGLLSGETYYVRLFVIVKFGAGDNDTIYSAARPFTTRSACGMSPYGLDATGNVDQTTALITWNPELGQTTWQVDCGLVGHVAGEGDFLQTVNDTFIVASDLLPGVDYTAYVRAACGETGFSEWSALTPTSYFRTLPYTCAPIAYVEAVQVRNTSAIVQWIPGAVTQWRWEIVMAKNTEEYPENGEIIRFNPTFNPIGLTPWTTYKVKVRAICNKHDDIIDTVGDWSNEITFYTVTNGLLNPASSEANLVKIYPNPTTGAINFHSEGTKIERIEIIDYLGKTIASLAANTTSFTFDEGMMGLFVVKIYTDQGLQTEKIIVE